MSSTKTIRFTIITLLCFMGYAAMAQNMLPPVAEWNGTSESLIAKPNDPWITPTEKSGFVTTPNYVETMDWLKKLCSGSPLLHMVSIGKSLEGRDIFMIIASVEEDIRPEALKKSQKPLFFAQAGIHSGEIDGKDAGMMLLRDIAFGDKKELLAKVNFLFIPILNVDGHERSSPYNRPNQRGPQNMGWRTNAKNLNLNRDYAKLDTEEIKAAVQVMNDYAPLLYMDIHVTDGADYQYDVTFGGLGQQGYSPAISKWFEITYKPYADSDLKSKGHIPGPLLFALNDRDFSQGNILNAGGPRFSDAYGNLRHMPALLVENHSLKPFKQRVLGTYVLLESTLRLLAIEGQNLRKIASLDQMARPPKIPMMFKVPQMENALGYDVQADLKVSDQAAVPPDSLTLKGISSKLLKSSITGSDYIQWTGKPETMTVVNYLASEPVDLIVRPKGYWVPAFCDEVLARLKWHGIQMEIFTEPREVNVEMYRIGDAKFENESHEVVPFEGHMQVNGTPRSEMRMEVFPAGSAYISTDQTLGDLAMVLLEPLSKDSFFSWGFFPTIFQRTEYMEGYVIEPMAQRMLEASPELKKEFEIKKAGDKAFAMDPAAILSWFYGKTQYYDERYLLYPIGRVL
jgi:hypothetical protein